MKKIPLVDLTAQNHCLRDELQEAIASVIESGDFILGEGVARFEEQFAQLCGAKYAVGVANGTDAIELALRAIGVGGGDEVILPVNTFVATAFAVVAAGAKPVFVDVEESTFLIDEHALGKSISSKTKAIIPVHLYGRACVLRESYRVPLLEDSCQAHGTSLSGLAAAFSFYPAKNLGALGDGGAVVTNDLAIKDRVMALRNYGSPKKYHHPMVGRNSRLDTIQAAALLVKLKHLKKWNEERYMAACLYNDKLAGLGDILTPQLATTSTHVFHLYVIRTKRRDALLESLNTAGIMAAVHYPTALHLHGAFAGLGYKKGDFPVAERLSSEILSLPLFPGITETQIDTVVRQIRKYFD